LRRYRQALLAALAGYALAVLALVVVGAGVAAAVWVVVLAKLANPRSNKRDKRAYPHGLLAPGRR
jgi:hypothetical protein